MKQENITGPRELIQITSLRLNNNFINILKQIVLYNYTERGGTFRKDIDVQN